MEKRKNRISGIGTVIGFYHAPDDSHIFGDAYIRNGNDRLFFLFNTGYGTPE